MNPLTGRCDTCVNYDAIGYCHSLEENVEAFWTGCCRWEPKPNDDMSDEFKIIKGVLNCSKIDKKRLFRKEGKEGQYLRIVLIQKKQRDKYGQVQFMIKEDITKEERAAGKEGNFIGDASAYKPKGSSPTSTPEPESNREGYVPF